MGERSLILDNGWTENLNHDSNEAGACGTL